MANPYSTPDTFDHLPCEEFTPWLGPGFQSSNLFIPDVDLFYDVELISILEEMISSWGPEAPVWAQAVPAPPLTDAYGSGPPVESVTPYYYDQSTDPIPKPFKPTDICLADMSYPIPEIGCNSFELCGPIDPRDHVSKPSEFTVQCN